LVYESGGYRVAPPEAGLVSRSCGQPIKACLRVSQGKILKALVEASYPFLLQKMFYHTASVDANSLYIFVDITNNSFKFMFQERKRLKHKK
jgi:hypothetical protein